MSLQPYLLPPLQNSFWLLVVFLIFIIRLVVVVVYIRNNLFICFYRYSFLLNF